MLKDLFFTARDFNCLILISKTYKPMGSKYPTFRDEILSFQYKVKDASGIFIYYKELLEILSTLNSKDKPLA